MNRKRLELALTVLEEVGKKEIDNAWKLDEGEEFDVENAIEEGEFPDQDTFDIRTWGSQDDCNTIACMAGWLTLDPRMQNEGLYPRGIVEQSSVPDKLSLEPTYKGQQGFMALEDFFDLSDEAISEIFGAHNTNSLEAGIERLKEALE